MLYTREDDINNVVSIGYWLSDGFDPDFKKLTREINPSVEPELISIENDADKVIKYHAIYYKGSKFEKIPPCLNGKKVVEVVIDKTSEQKVFVRNVWKHCNSTKFSLINYDPIIAKEWKPRTVKEAAAKWKNLDMPLRTTIGERLEKNVDSIVHMMFSSIDPVAIAADVNKK